jgi:hypothetical protein
MHVFQKCAIDFKKRDSDFKNVTVISENVTVISENVTVISENVTVISRVRPLFSPFGGEKAGGAEPRPDKHTHRGVFENAVGVFLAVGVLVSHFLHNSSEMQCKVRFSFFTFIASIDLN